MNPINKMTREEINLTVHKLAPGVPDTDPRLLQAAVYVAHFNVGTNADTISSFLCESRAKVRRVVAAMKSEGVFDAKGFPRPEHEDFWGQLQAKFMLAGGAYQPEQKQAVG